MTWLTPFTGLLAAGVAVPLLVLLYFLKLRRRQVVISSTLLWKRAAQDLQVNSPFQRLRWSVLLLLQLLTLAAVLVALAGPVISMLSGPPKRYVLLIDRSASMNAVDESPTRLEQAKAQARQRVESMRSRTSFSLQDQSDQAMVVAFDEHARVLCNFTSDKKQLLSAIDAITPTDGPTQLAEALAVARAFAQAPGEETNNRSAEMAAQLELFSDGRLADADKVTVAAGELTYHRIGKSGDNVGITAMQARRSVEQPEQVEVFATLTHYGQAALSGDLQLSVDGDIKSVRAVELPAAHKNEAGVLEPAVVSASFSMTHAQGGVVEVSIRLPEGKDALPADNAAWAILPPPKSLSALLVTQNNPALALALKAGPLAALKQIKPDEFDTLSADELAKYDIVVLDGYAPAKLPRGRYIVFGQPPEASGAVVAGELTNSLVIDWRARHPLLQAVGLGNLFVAKAYRLKLPAEADVVAEFADAPAIALIRRQGSAFLLVPFDSLESNWPFEPGFVMFCYNALQYLGREIGQDLRTALKVNQPIIQEGLPAGLAGEVTGPGKLRQDVQASPGGVVQFAADARAGVYTLAMKDRPALQFAVNIGDGRESDIRPADTLSLTGQSVAAVPVAPARVEIWPWLALAALILVLAEWVMYILKVRL